MKHTKLKICEYFDDLKNEIDIYCEKLLSNEGLLDADKEYCHTKRIFFLNEIDSILMSNLELLKTSEPNNEFIIEDMVDYISLNAKFCYFVPLWSVSSKHFGQLILTNQFINKNVREVHKMFRSFSRNRISIEDLRKSSLNLCAKDVLMANLIIELSDPIKEIIDLSDKSKNIINELHLNTTVDFTSANIESITQHDFEPIETLINKAYLKHSTFSFKHARLVENTFVKLDQLESLELYFDDPCTLESKCFNGLNSLSNILIYALETDRIEKGVFSGMNSLDFIGFRESKINALGEDAFYEASTLKELSIIDNPFQRVESSSFKGLTNLENLSLIQSRLHNFPDELFSGLKNLVYLNLHDSLFDPYNAKCFNSLENLEFLSVYNTNKIELCSNFHELELKKLRYLSINSTEVPNFRGLDLQFLVINGLESVNNDSFNGLQGLSCLILEIKMNVFKQFKKELFYKMWNLFFLVFSINDFVREDIDFIRQMDLEDFKYFVSHFNGKLDVGEREGSIRFEIGGKNVMDFFKNYLDVSKTTKSSIEEYHDLYYTII